MIFDFVWVALTTKRKFDLWIIISFPFSLHLFLFRSENSDESSNDTDEEDKDNEFFNDTDGDEKDDEEGKDDDKEDEEGDDVMSNKCLISNGGCAHICIPEDNSNVCTCRTGFVLAEDGKACQGERSFIFALTLASFSVSLSFVCLCLHVLVNKKDRLSKIKIGIQPYQLSN